jgi:WD40 repeat protein
MGLLRRYERQQLINLLLQLPNIEDSAVRHLLVANLPRNLQDHIGFANAPAVHITNIVDTVNSAAWLRLSNGSWPLIILLEDAVYIVNGSRLGDKLQALLDIVRARAQRHETSSLLPFPAEPHLSANRPANATAGPQTPTTLAPIYTTTAPIRPSRILLPPLLIVGLVAGLLVLSGEGIFLAWQAVHGSSAGTPSATPPLKRAALDNPTPDQSLPAADTPSPTSQPRSEPPTEPILTNTPVRTSPALPRPPTVTRIPTATVTAAAGVILPGNANQLVLRSSVYYATPNSTPWSMMIAFAPDSESLVVGTGEGNLFQWFLDDNNNQQLTTLARAVSSVVFAPDGRTIGVASLDGSVQLWNMEAKQREWIWLGNIFEDPLTGRTRRSKMSSAVFSPDGQVVGAGSEDGTAVLLRANTGELIGTFEKQEGELLTLAFSPDGQILATGSSATGQNIKLWHVADWKLLNTLNMHVGGVSSVAFAPDGQTLASAGYDRTVRLWRVEDGEPLREFGLAAGDKHTDIVNSVAFSPNSQLLASGSKDQTIRLWNVANGELLTRLQCASDGVNKGIVKVAFSPDGRTLAAGAYGAACAWKLP